MKHVFFTGLLQLVLDEFLQTTALRERLGCWVCVWGGGGEGRLGSLG